MMKQNAETYKTEYENAELVCMRLYQRSHALAVIWGKLEIQIGAFTGEYGIDGETLCLDAERLRRDFLEDVDGLCLEFLHMLSHCLLGHPFVTVWMQETRMRNSERLTQSAQADALLHQIALDREAWELTEQLWGEPLLWLKRAEEDSKQELGNLARLLWVDSHEHWQRRQQQRQLAKASGELGDSRNGMGAEAVRKPESQEKLVIWWEQQKKKLQRETSGRKKRRAGTAKRSRSQRLVPASGHRGDYREVLQSFSSFREDSRINPEEFQYAWYEYGLQTYGNMPLIEPLEYREERKIEDLVLVIDTSGSCEKDLVRIFLEETKGILEQDRLFFRRFCLHILQCDNQIQRDDKITNREEFEAYLENLTIVGGGGTDFRPAFQRIAKLQQDGEFRDLKGMLYFTDGSGLYPKEEPDYAVWFVMLNHHYDAIDMPDWIHRLVLEERSEI